MAILRKKQQPEQKPTLTAEFNQVIEVLPEHDQTDGRFFWQSFAERVQSRFDGLPAPDGGESFVRECLAAGCRAVPVASRNSLWKRGIPPSSEPLARRVYPLRIRLGLFYAGCLRYLIQGVSGLRARAADKAWYPVDEEGISFREFAAAQQGNVEVTWTEPVWSFGKGALLAHFFMPAEESLMLTPAIAAGVFNYALREEPAGLFAMMLYDDGQLEKTELDVAGVFLQALTQAVDQKRLRMNTPKRGDVFVTPAFWFVTYPICVGNVLRWLERGVLGQRYAFTRDQVVTALTSAGCLMGVDAGGPGKAMQVYEFDLPGWTKPLRLNGLAVKADKLPEHPAALLFGGDVTLRAA